ncbi:allophanate hydrolase [uncultured Kushneria sp.]|uniref:allophanate hydrolase n=1 Tax=uncultured Kushneria sp. TaxID=905033 RepID=UPI0026111CE9|nr:allophanate hydrolase [uncultured Kushneria sp.]
MTQTIESRGWTLSQWCSAQQDGQGRERLQALAAALVDSDTAWIARADAALIDSQWAELERQADSVGIQALPLYGVPFAIKDNIDAVGWETTAACPAFAYIAEQDATVVARLRAAGAILVGKTNLDQFATGLVGTRSPYGAVSNSFNPDYVSGGSSAGSASVVARGLVPFALGTDTAGSGRVPAGFNNIVGLKPTRGWLSIGGVVPACRTLDCVSVFALMVEDALAVTEIGSSAPDERDAYSRPHPRTAPVAMPDRPRLAIPETLEFHGDDVMARAFDQARTQLESVAELVPIDYTPFAELATLLYQGPWVAERTHAVGALLLDDLQAIDPTVRSIIEKGLDYSALDTFDAEYRRAELSQRIARVFEDVDALVVPTSSTIRTIAEMAEQPVQYNSEFGTYTNFTNLADLCALALPATMRDDGLPAGITLIAPAWHDRALADFGRRWQTLCDLPLGATEQPLPVADEGPRPPAPECVRVAVVGAHLRGMPLNFQLTTRRATFVETTHTASNYRLYALANTTPPKPGLARVETDGAAIEVELWDVPLARFGEFVAEIPAPLGIGSLTLSDGRVVKGFICESWALPAARDVTEYGGWRGFMTALKGVATGGEA